jgi:hypothetical protein
VPDTSNPQSLNRFTYVGNSPLNRIDPSGHRDLDCIAHSETCGRYIANPYIRFTGNWSYEQQETMIDSAKIIEYRLKSADAVAARSEARGYRFEDGPVSYLDFCLICGLDAGRAWQAVYGNPLLARAGPGTGAETFGNRNGKVNTIEFYDGAFSKGLSLLNNAIHEFGHLFAHHVGYVGGVQRPYNDLINTTIRDTNGAQIAGGRTRTSDGYRSTGLPWQQHARVAGGEDFADMFLNWSLDSFAQDEAGAGSARYGWINSNMPSWIALAVSGNH